MLIDELAIGPALAKSEVFHPHTGKPGPTRSFAMQEEQMRQDTEPREQQEQKLAHQRDRAELSLRLLQVRKVVLASVGSPVPLTTGGALISEVAPKAA